MLERHLVFINRANHFDNVGNFLGLILAFLTNAESHPFHLEQFKTPVISRSQLLHYVGLRLPSPSPILTFHKVGPGQSAISFPQITVIVRVCGTVFAANIYTCYMDDISVVVLL